MTTLSAGRLCVHAVPGIYFPRPAHKARQRGLGEARGGGGGGGGRKARAKKRNDPLPPIMHRASDEFVMGAHCSRACNEGRSLPPMGVEISELPDAVGVAPAFTMGGDRIFRIGNPAISRATLDERNERTRVRQSSSLRRERPIRRFLRRGVGRLDLPKVGLSTELEREMFVQENASPYYAFAGVRISRLMKKP